MNESAATVLTEIKTTYRAMASRTAPRTNASRWQTGSASI